MIDRQPLASLIRERRILKPQWKKNLRTSQDYTSSETDGRNVWNWRCWVVAIKKAGGGMLMRRSGMWSYCLMGFCLIEFLIGITKMERYSCNGCTQKIQFLSLSCGWSCLKHLHWLCLPHTCGPSRCLFSYHPPSFLQSRKAFPLWAEYGCFQIKSVNRGYQVLGIRGVSAERGTEWLNEQSAQLPASHIFLPSTPLLES